MQQQLKTQAGTPVFEAGSSAISVTRLGDPSLLEQMQSIVRFYFGRDAECYVQMENSTYAALVADAQDDLNRRGIARRLADDRRGILSAILGSDRIMVQSHLYLRAT